MVSKGWVVRTAGGKWKEGGGSHELQTALTCISASDGGGLVDSTVAVWRAGQIYDERNNITSQYAHTRAHARTGAHARTHTHTHTHTVKLILCLREIVSNQKSKAPPILQTEEEIAN